MCSVFLTIVAPVFNEEETIEKFYDRTVKVMDKLGKETELIFVNDGSTDKSLEKILNICSKDQRVKVVSFSRNFGHQIAITAGMDYASGEAIVCIDADLQDPPELIIQMVEKWQEGFDVVYAIRAERKGETFFKKITAKIFYRLIKRMTNIEIPLDTGDFRLISKKALKTIKSMREYHRFVRGMVSWIGYNQTGISFVREKRFAGVTKYPLKKMIKLALDGILSFSYFPLQLATYFGFMVAGISFLGIMYVVFLKIFTNIPLPGWSSQMISILFLGSVQLICLGIIGEYLGRIYDEVKKRPLYIVEKAVGFDENKKY